MTKLAPTPIIRAKRITAKDLLLRIKAIVLDEPKRLDMRWWVSRWKGKRTHDACVDPPAPACGTVGCIAGWGALLLRGASAPPLRGSKAARLMTRLVKPDGRDEADLDPEWVVDDLFDATTDSRPGTRAHAREVSKRIDGYLIDHPELATRVIDVKTKRILALAKRA